MHKHAHWLPQLIVKVDKYNNAAVNFLENYILGHTVNGRDPRRDSSAPLG